MFTIQKLVQPESLAAAYKTLIERKNNSILSGCAFLRMGSKSIGTAIDLSKLDLNYIREQEHYIEIGAMTNLREFETHYLLKEYFGRVLGKAVSNIIGVQFRNIVTVGATVFSKYGFSDVITALLALDTEVELYNGGRINLEDFLNMPYEKDILTRIFIKKNSRKAVYKDLRNAVSDYPILNVTVSSLKNNWVIVVGARPGKAAIAKEASKELNKENLTEEDIDKAADMASKELAFGTNMRGSEEYRKAMCKVLVKRAIMEVL
ncbi:FAD binding domain-containing protein [Clostridium pasteurianum]|uniref:Aerobic-type carbon monoxide dehydrogenase, middle subunit CoxM/CutM-like protein n=1 Tax=Clostridium pasteurianum BC1 TaxID=86416 RepID=R4K4J6_CLOPA|nr:FAD binding domain-containing protein [Clostridium pasteurianum]AGK95474.1 aerobic-type carbon monoxide dehydrogenase, middle subunit CoxM/CutM-like protein [Clostridium pasteurianum BC1]